MMRAIWWLFVWVPVCGFQAALRGAGVRGRKDAHMAVIALFVMGLMRALHSATHCTEVSLWIYSALAMDVQLST